MALQKIALKPGINREGTDYSGSGGWYDGNKIRFRSGLPEKIGGWTQASSYQYAGVCRILWSWLDSDSISIYTGAGTNLKYYIISGGSYYDITPIVFTSTLSGAIVATNGSNVLTITDATSTPNIGDYIIISGAVSLGGNMIAAVLNQEFVVTTIVSSTQFTVVATATANASDTGTGGTAIQIQYEYPVGLDVYITGTGWGAGPYSRGGWGSAFSVGIGQQLRLWSNDNFGTDLVIAPRGGAIAYWSDSTGAAVRAVPLQTLATTNGYAGTYVPIATNQVLTSPIQRFVIALGANSYIPGTPNSEFNPMLVRWSDQLNPFQWVPSTTNQSGEFPLSNGSTIVGGVSTRQENLIWTDSALYSMQYVGYPYVWGFFLLMDNISIMSPNAMITVNNITYWMGREKFYMYNGTVSTLPCSLRQYVFDDINKAQAYQVFCGANKGYNEVWWFYVSASSNGTAIDKYVIYNYLDNAWYYGTMGRTAWLDTGIQPYPLAADYNNRLLYHESSVDDVSGSTPAAIDSYVMSSDFDVGNGDHFSFVWRMLPDVNFNGSNVNNPYLTMTLIPRRDSGSAQGTADIPTVTSANNYATAPEYTIQQFTGQVYTRLRARQMAFKIESNSLGVAWQAGITRLDIKNDGKR